MEKDKAGTGPCCTPTVIPGAAPPRPKLGRGRRILGVLEMPGTPQKPKWAAKHQISPEIDYTGIILMEIIPNFNISQ